MIPSQNQQQVYDTWINTNHNLLLEAVAGGAKTTTLLEVMRRSEYRVLFLAFNKSIQEEVQEKINQRNLLQGKAMTVHALGLSAIKEAFGYKNVVVNNNKNWQLLKDLERFNKRLYKSLIWEEKAKVNITIMEMNDVSRLYFTNDVEEISRYMKDMDKYFYDSPIIKDLWQDFLNLREQTYTGKVEIDFTDMIYLVVKNNLYIPIKPYYLMIDEAQDLNIVQHKFIDMLLSQGDIQKWIAVGDRRQSIYGFSGAYASSFDLFKEKENVVELPLDVCYRCPQLIIDEANEVYNVMQGFKEENGIVDIETDVNNIKSGSMVICRNTNPLIDLYFQLMASRKKVFLRGDDILGSITKFLKPYAYKTISEAKSKISADIRKLEKKESKTDDDRFKLYKLTQNYKNFNLLVTNFQIDNDKVEVVLQSLNNMFQEIPDEEAIMLCTIHKAKGLEADVVYILNENLIPSKFAKSKQQLEQEKNLKYVARTRAKKELYYLNLEIENE